MQYNKNIPYNNLPLLPPVAEIETKNVLKKAISANKALAELRGWSFNQSNPLLLLQSLALQEAKASSEIENVVTTNDEIYQALSAPSLANVSPAAKEVMHYKEALWYGYTNVVAQQHPLTVNVFIELFRIVKRRSDGIRQLPGTCLMNSMHEVVYTPPDNNMDIMRLLSNLERYINTEDDVDPLIKLAVMHYQFECIHPFPDGNGRVGRIINVLYLVQEGLLTFPILYLSKYIIENKSEYYKALKNVTENNQWEQWILYILDAVEKTSIDTLRTIRNIHDAQVTMCELVKEEAPQIYSKELVELLFEQPYCKIDFLVQKGIAKSQTASKYLKTLHELNILGLIPKGREKYYINNSLWKILTQ